MSDTQHGIDVVTLRTTLNWLCVRPTAARRAGQARPARELIALSASLAPGCPQNWRGHEKVRIIQGGHVSIELCLCEMARGDHLRS